MTTGCPVTHDFAPLSANYLANPYKVYEKLRQETPIVFSPEFKAYVVSQYDDVQHILNDRDTFISEGAQSPLAPVTPEAAAILASGFPRKSPFTAADPPHHPKMRNAAARCFKPSRWAAVQAPLRSYVAARMDAHLTHSPLDLATEIVLPTTLFATFLFLGFPIEDTERVRKWCDKRIGFMYGVLPDDEQVIAAHNITDFWNYCRDFVRMRVDHPADDVTSDLLALSRQRGDDLTVNDIDNMVYSMALASHETTANALLNGIVKLMRDREAWDQLCRDPSLIPTAVEELLRTSPPLIVTRRKVAKDTTLSGIPLPAGSNMILLLGAANRDPSQFENPDAIDLSRTNLRDHLSFGYAWHFCLGAPLARFEFALLIEELTRRVPHMRLAAGREITYLPVLNLHGPEAVMVEI